VNERLFAILIASAGALWAFRNWRAAVKGALVLLVVEGAIRKWVFPGSQQVVYFAKDFLLLGAYAGYFSAGPVLWRSAPRLPLIGALLAVTAIWGALQVFNPRLPTPLLGLLGFKSYFLYVPLLFVLPATFRSDDDILRFLRRYLLLAIPIGLLAVFQFGSPGSSPLNIYARGGEDAYVSTFGSSEHVRVTATFSYITGFTSYLIAAAVLILTTLSGFRWRLKGNRVLYASLVLTLLGMLMSGSRAPVFMLAILLPFYWWLAVVREGDTGATMGRVILAITVLAAVLATAGGGALEAFLGRATATTDVAGRIATPFLAPLAALEASGVLGFGIGATHQAAPWVAPSIVPYSWLNGAMFEAETGRIAAELGLPGFLLVYTLRLAMAIIALRTIYVLRTRLHRSLATASFLFMLSGLVGSVVYDPTSGVFYWFFAGLLTLAIRLDRAPAQGSLLPSKVPTAVVRSPAAAARVAVPNREKPWRPTNSRSS
jgi:hypothetical protein